MRIGDQSAANAAWSYETPYDEASGVEGYIAFDWQTMHKWYAGDDEIAEQQPDDAAAKENPLVNWLVNDAWAPNSSRELVAQFSDAMIAAGIPLTRLRLLVRTRNPLLFALVYMWQRDGDEVTVFEISHENLQSDQYLNSPYALVINGEGSVRRRLEGPDAKLDFRFWKISLPKAPPTMCHATSLLGRATQHSDLGVGSARWFSTEQLGQIYEILPTMSRLLEPHALRLSSSTLLRTYLGSNAGQRVMHGLVKRGDDEDMHAAIWITDLRDSTSLAASMSREDYMSLLNRYFDNVAGAVIDHGGEVLKFIGDSVLAIFAIEDPDGTAPDACVRALAAAVEASRQLEEVNKARGCWISPSACIAAISLMEISVPSSIWTSPLSALWSMRRRASKAYQKTLNQRILISSTFAQSVPDPMVSLGQHTLRGDKETCEIFGLLQT